MGELKFGFQYRPPDRQPSSLDRIQKQVKLAFGVEESNVIHSDGGFQALVY